jgi:hypothetical protein
MNWSIKITLFLVSAGFVLGMFVASASAQSGWTRWEGNNGRHRGWAIGRHRGWRNRDRDWRDDDYRRYRSSRYRNSGVGILGTIFGVPNYGYHNNGYYNNGYYRNDRKWEKERRKAWKRYQKAQRKAYRDGRYEY